MIGSFGTNVPFCLSGGFYASFYIMGFLILCNKLKFKEQFLFTIILILIMLTSFIYTIKHQYIQAPLLTQNQILKGTSIKENIRLDKKTIENIKFIKKYVTSNDTLIISSPVLWGFVYFSEANYPSYLTYIITEEILDKMYVENKITNNTFLLEYVADPFPENFKTMSGIRFTHEVIKYGDYILYKPIKMRP